MKQIENKVNNIINQRYPKVESILDNISVDWKIFNISEQIMTKEGFSEAVKKVFMFDLEDLVKTEDAIALKPISAEEPD